MKSYHDTRIWKNTIGNDIDDFRAEREYLRIEYEKLRKTASLLAGEICRELPEYTVHDVSHSDALWEMADLFIPDDYDITPAEGFVLGAAFLVHDVGMALAVYPNGIESIRQNHLWRDTVASICKQRKIGFDLEKLDAIDSDIQDAATAETLRMMHAEKARQLGTMFWHTKSSDTLCLIDDAELRNAYGEVIGLIAQSHNWTSAKLREEFPSVLGAMSRFPSSWTVDPLKLSCILRIADAMHMDDRRAPSILKSTRFLNAISKLHWVFQEKLYQPRVVNNRIEYTSKSAFSLEDIDAWWLCYDMLRWLDTELRNIDAVLSEKGRPSFGIVGISGIDDMKELSKRIAVAGWEPIDTRIRVNNVAKLVHTLGGEHLYGENMLVPLRELIQNASDAIRARRLLDRETADYGTVTVTVGEEGGEEYIEVEDDGIGMSPDTMVNVLLDFGQSFWGTNSMHHEFPGLEQTSFQSTGKYGIGFFSVFMWGKHVKITSNRYDSARESTMVLEFSSGADARPVLRHAMIDERIKNGGTKIRVFLSEKSINNIFKSGESSEFTIEDRIVQLCPCLDCNLKYMRAGKRMTLLSANDWLSITNEDFLARLVGAKNIQKLKMEHAEQYSVVCHNLSIIMEQEVPVGRACILTSDDSFLRFESSGYVTVGGFQACRLSGICGILIGNTTYASRDYAEPVLSQETLDDWICEQVDLLIASGCSEKNQLNTSHYVCALSERNTKLKIAECGDGFMNYNEIVEYVRQGCLTEYILVNDVLLIREMEPTFCLNKNVFACAMGIPCILQTRDLTSINYWPYLRGKKNHFYAASIMYRVVNAIAEGWNVSPELLVEQIRQEDKESTKVQVGSADGKTMILRAYVLKKPT